MCLLPSKYTPQIQGDMTRLGGKLPFGQAVEEIKYSHKLTVTQETMRRITEDNGRAEVARVEAEVKQLERDAPQPEANPEQLLVSADGVMVRLTNGESYEVKSIAVGEFEEEWSPRQRQQVVKTKAISYFASSYRVRDFERYALAELHHRGLENATKVVAVNDGASWIQNFTDYHAPQATRIIDFTHMSGYLATAGKAVFGEGTPDFQQWFKDIRHQLKYKPPQKTLTELSLLTQKAVTPEQQATVEEAVFYMQSRLSMLDYPHFQASAFPIGSGSVESGHKVVVQPRLKGAGMRWAEPNLNPMLALRNLIANDRWSTGWSKIIAFRQQQLSSKRFACVKNRPTASSVNPPLADSAADVPLVNTSLSNSSRVMRSSPDIDGLSPSKKPYKPSPNHPWRRGFLSNKASRN
ncbi:MAG: hypothetical protein GWP17_00175 [Aquificales bacterium]|nr:hypothetical protein [Aquificales bacterium]